MQRETLMTWLNDAYAMEQGLVETLEDHRDHAEQEGNDEVRDKLAEHIEETKRHAELVKGSIERLGGNVSGIKSGLANLMGAMQGMATSAAEDRLIKDSLADYAAEHFEIASYTSLRSGAEELGDQETVNMCDQILEDEREMVRFLEEGIPKLTKEFLQQRATEEAEA